MKKVSIYLGVTLIVLSVFCCCATGKSPEKIDIDFQAFFDEDVETFCFDDLELANQNWDYVYLVSPYAEVDSIPIHLNETSLKKFRKLAMSDATYSALFYNEKRDLLFYALVPANIIDLTQIANKECYKREIFPKMKADDGRRILK